MRVPNLRRLGAPARLGRPRLVPWTEAAIGAADVVVITTAQSPIDYRALLAWSRCVVDTRNAIRARLGAELPAEHAAKLWQA